MRILDLCFVSMGIFVVKKMLKRLKEGVRLGLGGIM